MLGLLVTIHKRGSFGVTFYKGSSIADDTYKPLLIRIFAVKKQLATGRGILGDRSIAITQGVIIKKI